MAKNLNKNNSWSSMIQYRRRYNFLFFLVSIILLIVFSPYLQFGVISSIILIFLVLFVLLAGINSISDNRLHLIIACILGAPWIVTSISTTLAGKLEPEFYEAFFGCLFFIFTTVIIFSHILKDKKVTSNTLYGSICVYLLIGLTWTFFYVLVFNMIPNSFYINPQNNLDNVIRWNDLTYYSFVTLTTLGYGDITPVTSQARSLAYLEAIVGQIYLTIIIARLVGLYMSGAFVAERK